jgi:hypothetical protein
MVLRSLLTCLLAALVLGSAAGPAPARAAVPAEPSREMTKLSSPNCDVESKNVSR